VYLGAIFEVNSNWGQEYSIKHSLENTWEQARKYTWQCTWKSILEQTWWCPVDCTWRYTWKCVESLLGSILPSMLRVYQWVQMTVYLKASFGVFFRLFMVYWYPWQHTWMYTYEHHESLLDSTVKLAGSVQLSEIRSVHQSVLGKVQWSVFGNLITTSVSAMTDTASSTLNWMHIIVVQLSCMFIWPASTIHQICCRLPFMKEYLNWLWIPEVDFF